jgi:hypothetical protein
MRTSFPFALYLPGAAFVFAGILILVFPRLLEMLVAGLLLFVGISLLGVAETTRRTGRPFSMGRGPATRIFTVFGPSRPDDGSGRPPHA